MNGRGQRRHDRGSVRLLAALAVGVLAAVCIVYLTGGEPGDSGTGDAPAIETPGTKGGSRAATAPENRRDPAGDRTEQPRVGDPALPAAVRPIDGGVLTCLDAENRSAIAGVRAYDTQQHREVGVSDAAGRLELGRTAAGYLILHGGGCLASLLPAPVQDALARDKRAEVSLYRDRYTIPLTVTTEFPGGEVPAAIRLICVPGGRRVEGVGFPADRVGRGSTVPRELRRAWERHRLLISQVRQRAVVWHIGRQYLPYEMPAAGGEIRFAAASAYEIRAYGGELWARERVVLVPNGSNHVRLTFRPGTRVALRVLDHANVPVQGARIQLRLPAVPEEQARSAVTDARGSAVIAGLIAGERARVEVVAEGYEISAADLRISAQQKTLRLRPLPRVEHSIVVRERGSGRPIAGAVATLGDPSAPALRGRSDEAGVVRLTLTRDQARLLTLRHDDYLVYQEMLAPGLGSLPASCALVPKSRRRQRELGLIAVVAGVALKDGKPIAGVTVALMPWTDGSGNLAEDAIKPSGFLPVAEGTQPGRMVVRGARPEASLEATTDDRGRFEVYSETGGRAHALALVRGARKHDVFLVVGKLVEVRLQIE